MLAETRAALFDSGTRSHLLGFALSGRVEARARMIAAVAFTAPPLARRIVPEDEPGEHGLASGHQ